MLLIKCGKKKIKVVSHLHNNDGARFVEYKRLKDILNRQDIPYFDNYKVGNILSMKLYHMCEIKEKNIFALTKQILIKIALILFFDSYYINFPNENISVNHKKFLFMYSVGDNKRLDLKRLFENVFNLFSNEEKVIFASRNKKRFIGFRYKNIFRFIKVYRSLKDLGSMFDRIFISLMVLQIIEIKEKAKIIDVNKYSLFVTFCDVFEQDNLMVQTFRNEGIPTVSMQHGQAYCKKGFETSDDLEYENFTADYKLSWGPQTMNEMIKGGVEKSRIINVGTPKYIGQARNEIYGNNEHIFGVVFNNKESFQSNIEMIKDANKVCEKIKLKYCIKLHPADNLANYERFINKKFVEYVFQHEPLEDYLKKVYFSIANYSSIYMELYYYYHPTLLYRNELTQKIFKDDFNTYKNYEELEEIYSDFVLKMDEYKELIREKSHFYISENPEENIKKFLNSFKM